VQVVRACLILVQKVMQRPKISVIIPNYNHARYLAERIDSVLGQTFNDLELFILGRRIH